MPHSSKQSSILSKIENNPIGKAIISVILGVGLASLFRKTCKDGSCVVVRGPHPDEVRDFVYKLDGTCYKYVPRVAKCDTDAASS